MSRSTTAYLMILLSAFGVNAQQPQQVFVVQGASRSVVSVVHTVDLQKMLVRMREQNVRVGVAPSAPANVYNIATGLIVDDAGHIVTRLANLDLEDKNPKISITTSDGASMPARFIGVDCATGFAVLEASGLSGGLRTPATPVPVASGMVVSIVSSDVLQRTASSGGGNSVRLLPALKLSQGTLWTNNAYSKARGALTLLSNSLMSRNDSSVVQTFDAQVIGIAQWAGFGRAYLFPMAFIRDTVARRVIERKDNVPAGWLGAVGVSLAQLSEVEIQTLGVERKTGVVVREIVPESPAAVSGLSLNDVIVGVDGWDVVGVADLKAMLGWSPAGQKVSLKAIRNRQPLNVSVVLGARPDSALASGWVADQSSDPLLSQREEVEKRLAELQAEYRTHLKNSHSRDRDEALKELEIEMRQLMDMDRALISSRAEIGIKQTSEPYGPSFFATEDVTFKVGFKARELTSQLAAQFKALGGILISSVVKDSPAHRAGIRAGDVIVSSQDRPMLSIGQLRILLSDQQASISLKLIRDGQPTVVTLNHQ
ncbi:MAG: PDZ domain-containing protein [Acidobacteriota bacterium]